MPVCKKTSQFSLKCNMQFACAILSLFYRWRYCIRHSHGTVTQLASFITYGHCRNTIAASLKNQITDFTIASYPTFLYIQHDFCAASTVHFVKFRKPLVLQPFSNEMQRARLLIIKQQNSWFSTVHATNCKPNYTPWRADFFGSAKHRTTSRVLPVFQSMDSKIFLRGGKLIIKQQNSWFSTVHATNYKPNSSPLRDRRFFSVLQSIEPLLGSYQSSNQWIANYFSAEVN